jgi:catechol 2,3-dioxygenase-like lactoylglutathione lyase family enzyme
MKGILLLLLLVATIGASAQQAVGKRPKITGIDHVAFYTTAPAANNHLYAGVLGLATASTIEAGQTQRYMVGTQWVAYSPAPDPSATDRLDHVAFTTSDINRLRQYLANNSVKVPDSAKRLPDGSRSLAVKDPEGHSIEFVERRKSETKPKPGGDPASRRVIHAGFVVRDREAEDHFYKDILGFHLYWYGGMHEDRTDWVAMQVPDGTDWLEYMLNVAAHPDLRTTGVMNHISLGVVDMKVAQAKLESHGWTANDREHAQMGKDGKWQLNIYDPDFSRVELMEFKPVEKPCCSDFQGTHPQEP